jgi:[ribosomal protein S5]-alanine N-acetyltransferase
VPATDYGEVTGIRVFPDGVPTLVDGAVTLRAHRLSDVDTMLEQCTDPHTIRWTTVPVPFSREDAADYATKGVPAGWLEGTEFGFAIEAPHPDGVHRFCGSVSLRMHGDGVAEIAYGLHPAARGRGVCRRAVHLLVDWGFATQDVAVVTWYAEVGNWSSRRVAWAEGFSFDGTVGDLLVQRGERKDAWVGSLRVDDSREHKHDWNVPPVLETERLRLRPLADEDAGRLFEQLSDADARYYGVRVRGLRDLISGEQMVLRAREANAIGERYDWAVADRVTDRLVGHIQLFDLRGLDETEAKVGYGVNADSRRRGYLTEALTALTEWAFRPAADGGLGRRRLTIRTAASNTASRRGAERAGYTHVTTEPRSFTVGDSGFDDLTTYHRLNPDWVRADPG